MTLRESKEEMQAQRAVVIKEHNSHIYLFNSYWFQINIHTFEDRGYVMAWTITIKGFRGKTAVLRLRFGNVDSQKSLLSPGATWMSPIRLNICAWEFAGTPEQQVHHLYLSLLGLTIWPFACLVSRADSIWQLQPIQKRRRRMMKGSLVLFPTEHSMAAWLFRCASNLVCPHGCIYSHMSSFVHFFWTNPVSRVALCPAGLAQPWGALPARGRGTHPPWCQWGPPCASAFCHPWELRLAPHGAAPAGCGCGRVPSGLPRPAVAVSPQGSPARAGPRSAPGVPRPGAAGRTLTEQKRGHNHSNQAEGMWHRHRRRWQVLWRLH